MGSVLVGATVDEVVAYIVLMSSVLAVLLGALVAIVLLVLQRGIAVAIGLLVGTGVVALLYLPLAYLVVILAECHGDVDSCML